MEETPKRKHPIGTWILLGLAVALIVAIIVGVTKISSLSNEIEQARAENEELQLTNEQLQLTNEFDAISSEFAQYESQIQRLDNDSVLGKYQAAKSRIEALTAELEKAKREGSKSREQIAALQAKIAQLQKEVDTLRGLLKHYVAKIDSLGKENAGLRAENTEIRTQNEHLTSQVQSTTRANEELSQRMTLAEKLNVTGVSLVALNKKGKAEKNVTKATQLRVSFTIPQNNSTPVGKKTIFMRIKSPEGQLLGGAGSFSFEGGSVKYTASKVIEYSGQEVSVTMYWDVNSTLNPGAYTVELFCDNYRLASRSFTLSK